MPAAEKRGERVRARKKDRPGMSNSTSLLRRSTRGPTISIKPGMHRRPSWQRALSVGVVFHVDLPLLKGHALFKALSARSSRTQGHVNIFLCGDWKLSLGKIHCLPIRSVLMRSLAEQWLSVIRIVFFFNSVYDRLNCFLLFDYKVFCFVPVLRNSHGCALGFAPLRSHLSQRTKAIFHGLYIYVRR